MNPIGIKNTRKRIILGIFIGLAMGSGVAVVMKNPLLGLALAFAIALTFILPVLIPSKKETKQGTDHDI